MQNNITENEILKIVKKRVLTLVFILMTGAIGLYFIATSIIIEKLEFTTYLLIWVAVAIVAVPVANLLLNLALKNPDTKAKIIENNKDYVNKKLS